MYIRDFGDDLIYSMTSIKGFDPPAEIPLVSLLNPSLNKGLNGLSVNLDANISLSEGLASRFKKPPGILPEA